MGTALMTALLEGPGTKWLWILSGATGILFGAIGIAGYSAYRVHLVVRDSYSAENASYAIAKFIEKHQRPPASWKELDSSIRDACMETGYNYEDVIANAKIDFNLLNDRRAWSGEKRFVTTETGAELGNPAPNERILEQLRILTHKPETSQATSPMIEK
jgi:hypothetical protein